MAIRFPKINKCLCCCCMDFETAIKVCTILMCICYGISTVYSVASIFSLLYSIAILVSLVFLAIGLFKGNYSYMKQFIYVFLANLIISGIGIILLIAGFFFFKDSFSQIFGNNYQQVSVKSGNAEFDQQYNQFNQQFQQSYEAVNTSITMMFVIIIICSIISYGLEIYYYICTGSYIQSFGEDLERNGEARKLENNQY